MTGETTKLKIENDSCAEAQSWRTVSSSGGEESLEIPGEEDDRPPTFWSPGRSLNEPHDPQDPLERVETHLRLLTTPAWLPLPLPQFSTARSLLLYHFSSVHRSRRSTFNRLAGRVIYHITLPFSRLPQNLLECYRGVKSWRPSSRTDLAWAIQNTTVGSSKSWGSQDRGPPIVSDSPLRHRATPVTESF